MNAVPNLVTKALPNFQGGKSGFFFISIQKNPVKSKKIQDLRLCKTTEINEKNERQIYMTLYSSRFTDIIPAGFFRWTQA